MLLAIPIKPEDIDSPTPEKPFATSFCARFGSNEKTKNGIEISKIIGSAIININSFLPFQIDQMSKMNNAIGIIM